MFVKYINIYIERKRYSSLEEIVILLMPKWKRQVLVLHYVFNNNDFLMKRNEIRSAHLSYLRAHSKQKGGAVEFKVAESLTGKSFYWPLSTHQDDMIQFMEEDPYYVEGLVDDAIVYPSTVIERTE